MQRGLIYKESGSWLLRYYETELVDGKPFKKRKCAKLTRISPEYPTKRSVLLLAEKILSPINSGQFSPEATQRLVDFIEKFYLPHAKKVLRPSTVKGYEKDIYELHLRERLGDVRLKDFRTVTGQRLVASIPNLGHKTLMRIKSFLSGVFTYAKQEGVLDGENPMRGVKAPGTAVRYKGLTYSVEEIEKILGCLGEPARTVVATAAFSGLRLSELRGLHRADFTGDALMVSRSVWRTHVGPTKTPESTASVPVLPFLRKALEKHCEGKNPHDYIFAGERRGAPLNLHNLAARVIKPAIKEKGLQWKGWHSFRRALASNLYALGVTPKVIQAILRHMDIGTTLAYYVQTPDEESREAMRQLEESMWI